nr:unnamed protein product [Callosobruchus analis]
MSYSFDEMTDMLLIYGEAKNNGRQAVRLYEQKFPNRRIPHHSTFASIEMRLRETGNLRIKWNNAGRQRATRTVRIEEAILNNILERPSLSTRTIGKSINVSNSIVWMVLRERMLHPYKFTKVQALEPQNYPLRLQFCNWFSEKCREDRNFENVSFIRMKRNLRGREFTTLETVTFGMKKTLIVFVNKDFKVNFR